MPKSSQNPVNVRVRYLGNHTQDVQVQSTDIYNDMIYNMIWLFIYDTWHVQNIHIICHILRIFALRYNVVCMQACSLLPKACGMCGMWHVVTTALWQAIRWVRQKLWFMPKSHALFDHKTIALIAGIKISFKLYTHTHTHTHTRQMQNAKYIKAFVL